MAVWRRAAELQAEAATRLETRMRDAEQSAGASETSTASAPSDSYRVRDVEAAAAEVGISQRYVAIAMAELAAQPAGAPLPAPVPEWKERLTNRLLGTTQRTLTVSRIFRHPPRVVLQALGRTLQAPPFLLSLRDTLGGHPLDGGVLLFEMPAMGDGNSANYKWTWTRYGVYVPELRVSMATIAGEARACEVSMHVDLRRGHFANIIGYGVLVATGAGAGGIAGGIVAAKALLLTGAAILGPAVLGAAAVGVGALASAGPVYRWEIRKTTAELEAALAAIDAGIRALDIFGETGAAEQPFAKLLK
jgi:hypothetical protein